MTERLDRDTLEEMMTRYVLGDLGQDEAVAFERRLAEHPSWAEEVRSLQRTFHLLPYAVVVEPPPHLRARILRSVRLAGQPRVTPIITRLSWQRIVGTMAAGVMIVLGIDDYRLRRELDVEHDVAATLQQPNVVLSFSLRGTGTTAWQVFGHVLLDLDAEKAAVVIRGLPALPADQVYRLWAQVGTEKVPCGQFNANSKGVAVIQLPIPVDAYTAPVSQLIVTRESAAASPRPVGPTVMVSS